MKDTNRVGSPRKKLHQSIEKKSKTSMASSPQDIIESVTAQWLCRDEQVDILTYLLRVSRENNLSTSSHFVITTKLSISGRHSIALKSHNLRAPGVWQIKHTQCCPQYKRCTECCSSNRSANSAQKETGVSTAQTIIKQLMASTCNGEMCRMRHCPPFTRQACVSNNNCPSSFA